MDTSSTIIGFSLLLLFVGPIILLIYIQNKKNRKKLKVLNEIARENNLHPDITEVSPIYLLGLDTNERQLIIVEPANNYQSLVLKLKTIRTCEIHTIDFPNRPGKINFISLHLKPKDSKANLVEITFYDENDNVSMNAEVQMQNAKKWQNLIKRHLS